MEKLNKQDVFDLVYNHYADGGLPGFCTYERQCVYFADNGGNCAMGVLLAHLGFTREELRVEHDDGSVEDFNEEKGADDVVSEFGERLTSRLTPNVWEDHYLPTGSTHPQNRTFLLRMQGTHDSVAEGIDDEEEQRRAVVFALTEFATREGLIVPN